MVRRVRQSLETNSKATLRNFQQSRIPNPTEFSTVAGASAACVRARARAESHDSRVSTYPTHTISVIYSLSFLACQLPPELTQYVSYLFRKVSLLFSGLRGRVRCVAEVKQSPKPPEPVIVRSVGAIGYEGCSKVPSAQHVAFTIATLELSKGNLSVSDLF